MKFTTKPQTSLWKVGFFTSGGLLFLSPFKLAKLTSYVLTLSGYAISWKATLQSTIVLSITEAEYMALTKSFNELMWLTVLLGKIATYSDSTTIYCGNQSVILDTKDQMCPVRSKHNDVKFYFVWHVLSISIVKIKKITYCQ